MIKTPVKLTFEEYLTYSDGTDNRFEFVEGRLILMPPATGFHEEIIAWLLTRLTLEVIQRSLPLQVRPNGTEVRTTGRRTRRPDVIVITQQQADEIRNVSAILETPPPLVVEVVSPESIGRDYETKTLEYAAFGIPEYWIVDPLLNRVSVLLLVDGVYEETMFVGSQSLVSQTFWELTLTAEQALLAAIA